MPRAASTVSRSTCRIPTNALVSIGGMPSTISAMVRVSIPGPMKATKNAIRASSGTARPALPNEMARVSPRPRCPSQAEWQCEQQRAPSARTVAFRSSGQIPHCGARRPRRRRAELLAVEDELEGVAEVPRKARGTTLKRGHIGRGRPSARGTASCCEPNSSASNRSKASDQDRQPARNDRCSS